MHDQLARAIQEAVHEFFLAFLSLEVQSGPTFRKPAFEPYTPPRADVTGVVRLSGALDGGIHLSAPMHVALAMSSSFSGEPMETMSTEISQDAFGELTNLVAGGLQSRLADALGEIALTPPIVVFGDQYSMAVKVNFSSVKTYFRIADGPFFVECFFV
ncbi:MAG: chemotaxis protein CheX [Magnetococcales bacterium]|nr:chemotaxis protein CheX [Magnetococcales bacterium]MBF0322556.1 chemotaxis protein CheX [Magnetococcales bacterium]